MTTHVPPNCPSSLPKYLADGLPKQDTATLRDIQGYIDELVSYRERAIEPEELPDEAEVVESEAGMQGTVVEERVKCGADCTCNNGTGHGPYLYLYRREGGKLVSKYLGKPSAIGK